MKHSTHPEQGYHDHPSPTTTTTLTTTTTATATATATTPIIRSSSPSLPPLPSLLVPIPPPPPSSSSSSSSSSSPSSSSLLLLLPPSLPPSGLPPPPLLPPPGLSPPLLPPPGLSPSSAVAVAAAAAARAELPSSSSACSSSIDPNRFNSRRHSFINPLSHPLPPSVTHFDLNSLIEQNNLSEDSCLLVVDLKVYDLTLWLQDHLSSFHSQESQDTTPSLSAPSRPQTITYSDPSSSRPSPPPSPKLEPAQPNPDPERSSTRSDLHPHHEPNKFDRLLARAKSDPLMAGEMLRTMYDSEPFRSDGTSLEDWIREYRIGDFNPCSPAPTAANPTITNTTTSTTRTTTTTAAAAAATSTTTNTTTTTTTTIPSNSSSSQLSDMPSTLTTITSTSYNHLDRLPDYPNLSDHRDHIQTRFGARLVQSSSRSHPLSSDPNLPPSQHEPIQPQKQVEYSSRFTTNPGSTPTGSSTGSTITSIAPSMPSGRPCHLTRALELVARSKQQVLDAKRGVGPTNVSLSDAWAQLVEAEKIKNYLIHLASEGFRPYWEEWDNNAS